MWVDKTRVYAAKAIDNEYAYGRLNAGQQFYYTVNSYPLFLGKSQKNHIIRAIGNRPYFHQGDVTISYIDLSDTCAPWSCIRRNITAIIPHFTLYMMFPQIINASISVSEFGR